MLLRNEGREENAICSIKIVIYTLSSSVGVERKKKKRKFLKKRDKGKKNSSSA